jgi:CRP-like cAMP-binding protein
MSTLDLPRLLVGTKLFGSLGDADRQAIARQMRPVSYDNGQMIFARGDEGSDVYLLTQGRVRLSVFSNEGRELAFLNAGPGEIFGEIAALDGGVRTADARALSAVKAMVLSRAGLKRLMETAPAISEAAIRFLCARLRATNDVFEAVALHSIEVRLARFLLSAMKLRGIEPKDGKAAIDLGMSQIEVALLIGASRPKVNLALQALEADSALKREGNGLILFTEKLKLVADRDDA